MGSDSLASLTNLSLSGSNMPLFAGGVAAFSVAALVIGFVRRTKKKLTKRPTLEGEHTRKPWRKELEDDLKNVWATARGRDRKETYVNPIDVWQPSDLERRLERIPGPPSILEMDPMDGVQDTTMMGMESPVEMDENTDFVPVEEVVKMESREQDEEMSASPYVSPVISPVPSFGPASGEPLICTYPGCKTTDTFPNRGALKHHARYHIKNNFCPHCDSSFAVPKDLKRHIVSKHIPKNAKKVWFCTVHGCKNTKMSMPRTGIDRKDNWQRHMRVTHGKGPREIAALESQAFDDA